MRGIVSIGLQGIHRNHGADDSAQMKRHAVEMTVHELLAYTNQMAADLRAS
jgi:hypothetical protein